MTNRREFLKAATALSAVPLMGGSPFAIGREPVTLDAVIFDLRHPDARTFAACADQLGAPCREIEGDVTNLWQDELRSHWQAAPAAIAGLTERPALFLLERLAWDHGLRVVFAAEHAPDGRGYVAHRIIRTTDAGLAQELEAAGWRWPRVLADIMIAGPRVTTRDFRPTDTSMAAYPGEPAKLYSWVIAPRTAA